MEFSVYWREMFVATRQITPVLNLIHKEIFIMNKDQVKGSVKQAAGKVQQKTGETVGSEKHQVKGAAKQAEGKVQKEYGNLKDNHK
jgi:uncharacterized protein YjbJ (UPF0337 family)